MTRHQWRMHVRRAQLGLSRPLTGPEQDNWRRHVAACPACRQAEAWDRIIDQALARAERPKASGDFNRAVWAKIQTAPARLPWQPAWWPALAGAGLLAAAVLAGVWIGWQGRFPKPTKTYVAAPTRLAAPMVRPGPSVKKYQPANHLALVRQPRPTNLVASAKRIAPETGQPTPAQPAAPSAPVNLQFTSPGLLPGSRSAFTSGQPPKPGTLALAPAPGQGRSASGLNANQYATAGTPAPGIRILNNTIHLSRGEVSRLEITLAAPGRINARVFSREGRLVKTLMDGAYPDGMHTAQWDGTSDTGERVASGIYVLYVTGDLPEKQIKLAVIK